MIKKVLAVVSFAFVSNAAFSQCTNCGMGTNSPQSKLEVKGCGNTSATSSLGVKNTSAGSDSVMLFVRDDGNVGIGNFAPAYPLDIQKNGTGAIPGLRLFNKATAANNNGSQLLFGANRTTSGLTDIAGISGIITDITQAAYKGALIFYTSNNAAPAERMRIDNAGNVGIGVTPTSTFHVVSTASTTNGSDIIANSITTGFGMNVSSNALTTGSGFKIATSATGITTGSLMLLSSTGAIANASGSVLNVTSTGVNTAGYVAKFVGNALTTGSLIQASATAMTTGIGLDMTTNALTTGSGIKISSSATGITTGSLMFLSSTGAIGNASGSVLNITSTGVNTAGYVAKFVGNSLTTGSLIQASATAMTTGIGLDMTANALTTGSGIKVASSATGITTGSLMLLSSTGAIANASGSVLNITSTGVNTAGNVATIVGNSATTGNILNLSGTGLTTGSVLTATAATTTGKGVNITTNGITSGTALDLNSTSTVGTGSGTSKLINIARSGANANASHTAYGVFSAITNTGTTSTNVAGYFSASGATNNNAIIVPASGGNVGIGTSTPASLFSVGGTGNALFNIYGYQSSTSNWGTAVYGDHSGAASAGNRGAGVVGNIVCGTAGNYSFGVYGKSYNGSAQANGRAYGVQGYAGNASSGYNYGVYGKLDGSNNGSGVYGADIANGDNAVPGSYAGYFAGKIRTTNDSPEKATGGSWTGYSDSRLKRDVLAFNDGLSTLRNIHTVKYKFNGIGGLPTDREYIGVVAQDVQGIAPYCVSTGKLIINETEAPAFGANARYMATDSETKIKKYLVDDVLTYNPDGLFYVMLNAIKELDVENQSLKARIQALENK